MQVTPHNVGAKFVIRDYCPADFETLWQIDQRCFPPGISYSRLELTGFLTKRNAIALVAEWQGSGAAAASTESDRAIGGFVVAHSIRRTYGRILTLDVLPEARRCGIGASLMAHCEARLRASGCREAYLETAVDNEAALRLYRKLGYEVLETLRGYYASHGLDAYRMGKHF